MRQFGPCISRADDAILEQYYNPTFCLGKNVLIVNSYSKNRLHFIVIWMSYSVSINSYGTPLAQTTSYLAQHSSLYRPDGAVNYDYIAVTVC